MNKTDRQYFETRIEETVKCTNGEVSTKLNKLKKKIEMTEVEKWNQIYNGEATHLSREEISNLKGYSDAASHFLKCFNYKKTAIQLKNEEHNRVIDNRIDSIHTEIMLEGRRLLDRIVVGIVTPNEIPDELKKLGEMVALAN